MHGTIVTLGGGGFSMSDDGGSAIDDYLLDLSGVATPKVCFIPTAAGDEVGYCGRFLDAFEGRARTSVYSLFGRSPWGYPDPETLLDQDVIYVGGGSTPNLLAVWRAHGLPAVLAEALAAGTIMAGVSAGMNCWFEGSVTDAFGPMAPLADGLGFLAGSSCPHYRGEPGRRDTFLRLVGDGTLAAGFAVDDYAALLFRDGQLADVVAEAEGSRAFRVELHGESVRESPLEARVLARRA